MRDLQGVERLSASLPLREILVAGRSERAKMFGHCRDVFETFEACAPSTAIAEADEDVTPRGRG
jgi:hypothetical protein